MPLCRCADFFTKLVSQYKEQHPYIEIILEEVDEVIRLVIEAVETLRNESPSWALYKDGAIS